jgi:phosphatidate cytidylyltransferase
MLVLTLGLMLAMAVYVACFPKYVANQVMCCIFGVFYVAVMLSYIFKTRTLNDGVYVVWLIFVSSWVSDTFAYLTGVTLGKHKMTPKLSPKKSVEGAVGGVASSVLVGALYGYIVSPHMTQMVLSPVFVFAVAGGIGALLSIVGDLAASAIKRNFEVKDYGSIIPGHGGILDRFDSVIFTAPVVYWAVYIVNAFL